MTGAQMLLKQMGLDPEQLKNAFESTVNEMKKKIDEVDSKLERIIVLSNGAVNFCELLDERLIRLEIKFDTLPQEDIFHAAVKNGLLLPKGASNDGSDCATGNNSGNDTGTC